MDLIIVESPTKAKTISKFLGPSFTVESSYGHVRDLPEKEMGIDIANDFTPKYVIPKKSSKTISLLKKITKKSDQIFLATDEDREGEAIAWHLARALELQDSKTKRIAFHEITQEAIEKALKHPREIDMGLVDSQQARRILDRLVGYELSPFLWKKVAKGLSAGRVQSVAMRMIVEREREIQAFKPQEYWSIEALLQSRGITRKTTRNNAENIFKAKLHKIGDKVLDKFALTKKEQIDPILESLKSCSFKITEIISKQTKRNPLPPFTTSSLQQEANRRLYFSAKQTMMFAQQLYENGFITYMRTDSVNLSEKFLSESRNFISTSFGNQYLPASSRRFTTKSKLAQEAHEAVRPTNVSQTPEKLNPHTFEKGVGVKTSLTQEQIKLYTLIWQRAVASQMKEAKISTTVIEILAARETATQNVCESALFDQTLNSNASGGRADESGGVKTNKDNKRVVPDGSECSLPSEYFFRATGSIIQFDGFLKVYPTRISEVILPTLKEKEELDLKELKPEQHFTEPPARFSDASLVGSLEKYGIGRPSTYAPTIATIIDRRYVERIEARRLKPTEIAFLVNDLLVAHFPVIVDYKFTAKMEDSLDEIAQGEKIWVPVIKEFYTPFKENLDKKYQEVDKKELTEEKTSEVCEKCGSAMIIKLGRYGKFLACSGFPKCKNIKSLKTKEKPAPLGPCPKCGMRKARLRPSDSGNANGHMRIKNGEIVERRTKKGRRFWGCNKWPDCDFASWKNPIQENEDTTPAPKP